MAVLPQSRAELIQWVNERIALWAANPTSIGLTSVQLTQLASILNTAMTKKTTAFTLRNQSEAATFDYHTHADALHELVAIFVKLIKTHAEVTNDPSVYSKAQIPFPATPAPLGPPPQPTQLVSALDVSGNIELRWKCTRKGGTSFNIFRRTTTAGQPAGQWSLIGTSEKARFTDENVPVALASATYRIVAVRAGGSSLPSDVSTVFFGTGTGQESDEDSGNTGLTIAA